MKKQKPTLPNSQGPLKMMPCYRKSTKQSRQLSATQEVSRSIGFLNRTPTKTVTGARSRQDSHIKIRSYTAAKSEKKSVPDMKLGAVSQKTPVARSAAFSEFSHQEVVDENMMLKSQIFELQNVIVSMCVINQRQTLATLENHKKVEMNMKRSASRTNKSTASLIESSVGKKGGSRPGSGFGMSAGNGSTGVQFDAPIDINFMKTVQDPLMLTPGPVSGGAPFMNTDQPNIFEAGNNEWLETDHNAVDDQIIFTSGEVSTEQESSKHEVVNNAVMNADLSGMSFVNSVNATGGARRTDDIRKVGKQLNETQKLIKRIQPSRALQSRAVNQQTSKKRSKRSSKRSRSRVTPSESLDRCQTPSKSQQTATKESNSVQRTLTKKRLSQVSQHMHIASQKSADFTPIVSAAQENGVADLHPTLRQFNQTMVPMPQPLARPEWVSPTKSITDTKPIYSLQPCNSYPRKQNRTTKDKKKPSQSTQLLKGFFHTFETTQSQQRKPKIKPPVPTVKRGSNHSFGRPLSVNQKSGRGSVVSAVRKQAAKIGSSKRASETRDSQGGAQLFNMTMEKINIESWKKASEQEILSRKSSNSRNSNSLILNKSFGSNNIHASNPGSRLVSDSKLAQNNQIVLNKSIRAFDAARKTPSPSPAAAKLPTQPSPSLYSKLSDSAQPAAVVAAEMSLLGLTGKIDPIKETADFDNDHNYTLMATEQSEEDVEGRALLKQIQSSDRGPLHTGPSTLHGSPLKSISPVKREAVSPVKQTMSPSQRLLALQQNFTKQKENMLSPVSQFQQQSKVFVPRLALDKMNLNSQSQSSSQPGKPVHRDTRPHSGVDACKIVQEPKVLHTNPSSSNFTESPDAKRSYKITEESAEPIGVFCSEYVSPVHPVAAYEPSLASSTLSTIIKMQKVPHMNQTSQMSSIVMLDESTPTIQQCEGSNELSRVENDTIHIITAQPSPDKMIPHPSKAPVRPQVHQVENATKVFRKTSAAVLSNKKATINRNWNFSTNTQSQLDAIKSRNAQKQAAQRLQSCQTLATSQKHRKTPTKTKLRSISKCVKTQQQNRLMDNRSLSVSANLTPKTNNQMTRTFDSRSTMNITPVSQVSKKRPSNLLTQSSVSRERTATKDIIKSKKNLLYFLSSSKKTTLPSQVDQLETVITKDLDTSGIAVDLVSTKSNQKLSSTLMKPVLARPTRVDSVSAISKLRESEKIRQEQSNQLLEAQRRIDRLQREMMQSLKNKSKESKKQSLQKHSWESNFNSLPTTTKPGQATTKSQVRSRQRRTASITKSPLSNLKSAISGSLANYQTNGRNVGGLVDRRASHKNTNSDISNYIDPLLSITSNKKSIPTITNQRRKVSQVCLKVASRQDRR